MLRRKTIDLTRRPPGHALHCRSERTRSWMARDKARSGSGVMASAQNRQAATRGRMVAADSARSCAR